MKKKIIAFTAIRSEYDLLSNVYRLLNNDPNIEFQLIVSGAHLTKMFGYSVQEIEDDGLKILAKIETLLNSDSKASRVKSGAILLQNSIDIVAQYAPDLIIYAGDREEVIVASIIGGYLEIPTIHFFGGDHVKDSHIDNPIRHATSKLSTVHIVSQEEHFQRLIKMGESKDRIFNIGSVALDKFVSEQIKSKLEIKKHFNLSHTFDNFSIVIFHPIPKERYQTGKIFENILLILDKLKINAFVSYPNIDPGNYEIVEVIERYKENKNFVFYKNLPRNLFLSIYKNATFIIGNSSSGILESASIPIPAINVGYRQKGRKANDNVLFCETDTNSIEQTIIKALSQDFQKIVHMTKNIYGDGFSAQKAVDIIKSFDFKKLIFKDEDPLEMEECDA